MHNDIFGSTFWPETKNVTTYRFLQQYYVLWVPTNCIIMLITFGHDSMKLLRFYFTSVKIWLAAMVLFSFCSISNPGPRRDCCLGYRQYLLLIGTEYSKTTQTVLYCNITWICHQSIAPARWHLSGSKTSLSCEGLLDYNLASTETCLQNSIESSHSNRDAPVK